MLIPLPFKYCCSKGRKYFAQLYVPGVTCKQMHFVEGPSCLQKTAGNGWRHLPQLERAGATASPGEGQGCWRTSRTARAHRRQGRGVAPTGRQVRPTKHPAGNTGQAWALGRGQLREEAVASSSPHGRKPLAPTPPPAPALRCHAENRAWHTALSKDAARWPTWQLKAGNPTAYLIITRTFQKSLKYYLFGSALSFNRVV